MVEAITFDARGNGDGTVCNTITGDHENRITDYTSVVVEPKPTYCIGNGQTNQSWSEEVAGSLNCMHDQQAIAIDRAFFNQGVNAQYDPQLYEDGINPTLVAKGPSAVCTKYVDTTHADDVVRMDDTVAPLQARDYKGGKLVFTQYIVRRLTPTECARLQGFPDAWGHPDVKDSFTDEEHRFWMDVRNTHAAINGKAVKEYTKEQMLKWYNKLHTDSAEYKMWGNGIALPNALYVMQGIAEELSKEE